MGSLTHPDQQSVTTELATLARHACRLLQRINRSNPVGEAQVAAAEILSCLTEISATVDPGQLHDLAAPQSREAAQSQEALQIREEVLLQALGAGRAAVGALGFALIETRSSRARLRGACASSGSP